MMFRRLLLAGVGAISVPIRVCAGKVTPGVSASELKIGNTAASSGPASAYGIIARTEAAVFKR